MYIFKRESITRGGKGSKPDFVESFFDLQDVVYTFDECTVKFKTASYHFLSHESDAMCVDILRQLRRLLWNVDPNQVGLQSPIFAKPNFLAIPALKERPANIILHRYVTACLSKKYDIEDTVVEVFKKFTANPKKVISFGNFELQNPTVVFFTVAMEGDVKGITLDNCSKDNFGQMLNSVFVTQNRGPFTLDLRNYETAQFEGMVTRFPIRGRIRVLRFQECGAGFLSGFLQNARGANVIVECLVFDKIRFEPDAAQALIKTLRTLHLFSALLSLCFVGCSCSSPPFVDFVMQCLNGRESLTTFQAEDCGVDICEVLRELARLEDSKLQNVNLRRNVARATASHDDTILWASLLWLNLGESEWSAGAFRSFIAALCRRKRRTPLALSVDATRVDGSWGQIFHNLPLESLVPVVTELNFSRNSLDAKSYERFNQFLETQSPLLAGTTQYPNKLAHLNISHCFSSDIPLCKDRLFTFFETRALWGLEVCGIEPDSRLSKIRGLHCLKIGDDDFGEKSALVLKTFVRESPTIAEIGIGNIEFKEVSVIMAFYLDLLAIPRLLAFERPTLLLQQYPTFNETVKIRELLRHKRGFSNTPERLQLFLSLSGDFAARVARPPVIAEDLEATESQLFETSFINPIPSLFTLATLSTLDVSVEPIASMVTEYVATSGRYGIVPPTAPPPSAPPSATAIPAIYATMQSASERNGDIGFDLDDSLVQEWSTQIAGVLKTAQGTLDIDGSPEAWNDTRALLTFEPLVAQQ
jgi:hypothetical protein